MDNDQLKETLKGQADATVTSLEREILGYEARLKIVSEDGNKVLETRLNRRVKACKDEIARIKKAGRVTPAPKKGKEDASASAPETAGGAVETA